MAVTGRHVFSRRGTRLLVAVLLGVAAALAVIALRHSGVLQGAELALFDVQVRRLAEQGAPDPRVLVVAINETDLDRHGWPLSDDKLAAMFEHLLQARPRVIALDMYRTQPVAPGQERLRTLLQREASVLLAIKISERGVPGVAGPGYITDPQRLAFTDMLPDEGGRIRRGLLYLDDGQRSYIGLGQATALRWLQAENIRPRSGNQGWLHLGAATIPPFEANDGPYRRADAAGYQVLLDFAGGRHAFSTVSLDDVLQGRVPAAFVRDRMVLVGVAALSVKDHFPTALSRADEQFTDGVVVHAHVASQLVRMALGASRPLQSVSQGWTDGLGVATALVMAVLVLLLRRPLAAVGLLVLVVVAQALLALAAMQAGWYWPALPLGLAGAITVVLVSAWVLRLEQGEKHELMGLFSRYVSAAVAEQLWQQRSALVMRDGRVRAQRLQATVLFSDLRGFTRISEQLSAEQLMEWLEEYTAAMSQIVLRHGGLVDKFIGDAVMAVFGAPVARTTTEEWQADARAAVAAAQAMAEGLRALNRSWAQRGLPAVAMRIGIATGPVVAGSLGSDQRLEYTVIGDTVNIAARLESLDKEWPGLEVGETCRLLLAGATVDLLGDSAAVHPCGELVLKGKQQAVPVYRIRFADEGPHV